MRSREGKKNIANITKQMKHRIVRRATKKALERNGTAREEWYHEEQQKAGY
jgi:hypothetical protein